MAEEAQDVEPRQVSTTRYFQAQGRVQKVMFRQTLIRGLQARGIAGGATNEAGGHVTITLTAPSSSIEEVVEIMASGKKLNSWGARCTEFTECVVGKAISEHQVSTANVDGFNWNKNVKMFF